MIAHLRGPILTKKPDQVILDLNGVGYRVFISLNTFYRLPEPGQTTELLVQTVVRDDAIHLYGFKDEAEKKAFTALCSISGVGPRLGLNILSGITPEDLWLAVRARDTKRLTKVPGIGKKIAARLVVELEGKLPPPQDAAQDTPAEAPAPGDPAVEDAVSALVNLGYPEPAARKQVAAALKDLGPQAPLEELLRVALRRAT